MVASRRKDEDQIVRMIEALTCLRRRERRNVEDQIVQMIGAPLCLRTSQRRVDGQVVMIVAPQVNLAVEMITMRLLDTRVTIALRAGRKRKDMKRQSKEVYAILTMASLLGIIDLR